MPARIVLVHDDPEFVEEASASLEGLGYSVATFLDPMKALDALDAATMAELLITRIDFPSGQPHGIALAQMVRYRRPGIRVLLLARPELIEHAEGVGDILVMPVPICELVKAARQALEPEAEASSAVK